MLFHMLKILTIDCSNFFVCTQSVYRCKHCFSSVGFAWFVACCYCCSASRLSRCGAGSVCTSRGWRLLLCFGGWLCKTLHHTWVCLLPKGDVYLCSKSNWKFTHSGDEICRTWPKLSLGFGYLWSFCFSDYLIDLIRFVSVHVGQTCTL